MDRPTSPALEFTVYGTQGIPNESLSRIRALFHDCYVDAEDAYLDQSFSKLHHLALATSGPTLAGFRSFG